MSESRTNSNLEFRKIKSLKFLYEINENGTILRNVKSKKQVWMQREHDGWMAYIHNQRIPVRQLVAECWLGECPEGYELRHIRNDNYDNNYHNLCYACVKDAVRDKPLYLTNGDEIRYFESITDAAVYVAHEQYRNVNTVRQALKRRKHAYGYEISFAKCRD